MTAAAAAAFLPVTALVMLKHQLSLDMTCGGCMDAICCLLNKVEEWIQHWMPSKKVCVNFVHNMDSLLVTLNKMDKSWTISNMGTK